MMRTRRDRLAIVLCLLAVLTAAWLCGEPEDEFTQDENPDVDAAPELYSEPVQVDADDLGEGDVPPDDLPITEEPEPTELVFTDDFNDVLSLFSGEVISGWGPGLDLGGVVISVDPASGDVVYKISTPGLEDSVAFIESNPNWGLIIAGDGDPEGTPALPGLDMYGMGQWHIGCFTLTGQLSCELWVRQGNQFVQEGEAFAAEFVEGAWNIFSPAGFPRPGDRLGFVVVDPYYYDTMGLEDWEPTLGIGQLKPQY